MLFAWMLATALVASPAPDCGLTIQRDRVRDLTAWKPQIQAYSQRHYGENTWQLDPVAIVLHYTVSKGFPWNLVNTAHFAGETPGLAVHYVVDGDKIWEILPPTVRSRGAYGINHRAINIELVAMEAHDLARRPKTLATAAKLTTCLMQTYAIPRAKVYSHEAVSKMDPLRVPEVKDLLNAKPYGKSDPGEANMRTILQQIPPEVE
jgi:hypothetical protein